MSADATASSVPLVSSAAVSSETATAMPVHGSGVRIASVETLVVNAGMRNWVLVRVRTDVDGLYGWGEATLEWQTRAVVGAVADLAPLLVGEDPLRVEHLWQSMYRRHFFKGGAVTMSAVSGIDQALHDIAGKHLWVPAYQLLGGRVRDEVRFYDHLGGGAESAVYGAADHGPGALAEAASCSVAAGFDALKFLPIGPGPLLRNQGELVRAAERVALVREAVGDGVDLMLDLHGRTSAQDSIRLLALLEPSCPWFVEEPCQPEDVHGLARVVNSTPVPIATGERIYTRSGFRELLEIARCAVIQPDVCHCGGLSELRKIAAMAEVHGVAVAPHNPLGPIATMASLHLAVSTPNFLIQEVMRADVPWRDDVLGEPLQIRAGRVAPPTAPGLGVEVDEAEAAKHPYVPEAQLRTAHADGAVADW
jgi:galactonate dehydratase